MKLMGNPRLWQALAILAALVMLAAAWPLAGGWRFALLFLAAVVMLYSDRIRRELLARRPDPTR